jgi:UDP-3-O-[3-hydroxymyristoyl] N-acetylglucosamine deacetylase
MDGLSTAFPSPARSWGPSAFDSSFPNGTECGTRQRTLGSAIGCVGIGLHGGRRVSLSLIPAPAGTGIVFHRTDLGIDIAARFDNVVDTRLCTVIGNPDEPAARVGTIEHLMAALAATGITNVRVTVDAPELPILDGSAANFVFLIDCAGIVEQDAPAPTIEVLRTVRVEHGEGFCELRPAPLAGLDMSVSIAFDAPAIGRQALSMGLDGDSFRAEIARARTFTLAGEVTQLRAAWTMRWWWMETGC